MPGDYPPFTAAERKHLRTFVAEFTKAKPRTKWVAAFLHSPFILQFPERASQPTHHLCDHLHKHLHNVMTHQLKFNQVPASKPIVIRKAIHAAPSKLYATTTLRMHRSPSHSPPPSSSRGQPFSKFNSLVTEFHHLPEAEQIKWREAARKLGPIFKPLTPAELKNLPLFMQASIAEYFKKGQYGVSDELIGVMGISYIDEHGSSRSKVVFVAPEELLARHDKEHPTFKLALRHHLERLVVEHFNPPTRVFEGIVVDEEGHPGLPPLTDSASISDIRHMITSWLLYCTKASSVHFPDVQLSTVEDSITMKFQLFVGPKVDLLTSHPSNLSLPTLLDIYLGITSGINTGIAWKFSPHTCQLSHEGVVGPISTPTLSGDLPIPSTGDELPISQSHNASPLSVKQEVHHEELDNDMKSEIPDDSSKVGILPQHTNLRRSKRNPNQATSNTQNNNRTSKKSGGGLYTVNNYTVEPIGEIERLEALPMTLETEARLHILRDEKRKARGAKMA